MNRKKLILALLVCIVLFTGALVLTHFYSGNVANTTNNLNPVVISEVLASNRTYPAPNGKLLDFIEIYNTTNSPLDISGYMLSDREDSIGYTFPNGTILPAKGYAVCWCDKESDSDRYGNFGISKKGNDTILLFNSSNVCVDEYQMPPVGDNISMIRLDDGTWEASTQSTPGFANSEEGFAAWLQSVGAKEQTVVISEIMSGSSLTVIDSEGHQSDWVELLNTGSESVNLAGCYLSDDPASRAKWMIPDLTLAPGERAVIRCAGSKAENGEANFALTRDGCTVILTGVYGNTLSLVEVPELGRDCSWALQDDGTYLETTRSTPGYENTQAGYDAWLQSVGSQTPQILISEVMTSNRSTVVSENGSLCDWVELYNPTSSDISLSGLFLSSDTADRMQYRLPDVTLTSGERIVIRCSGGNAPDGEAPLSLPRGGCPVILSGAVGNVIAQVEVPRLEPDRSWALGSDGNYAISDEPTPGYANTHDGYISFRATQTVNGPLIISEVMPSNAKYLQQSDKKFYDWVELKNISDDPIRLSNYRLSDDPDKLNMFTLPDVTLQPGEHYVIICSGYPDLTSSKYTHAPFTLSREESWVYLSRVSDGRCVDFIRIFDVPYQHSVGRMDGENGTYYFTTPTPGTQNGSGVAFISETPRVLTPDGVYNGVADLRVEFDAPGTLYYTLDGSIPTKHSNRYTGPITLNKTTALRVVSIEEGKLPSDIVTAAYIINENHTLPVISIVADPDELFGPSGIYTKYTQDKEIRCNLKLFENGAGFDIDCGVKLYGHMGLKAPKKSFKVNFRGRYGSKFLAYPVYGEDGPDVFDSLCIRAGQDYPTAIFRDELFTSLCREMSDSVLAQRDKFSILYVNGEYFGIYCMKEAFTETFYAQNMGGSADNVTIVQAPFGASHELYALNQFCRTHDMTVDENYQYVADRVDIDSVIDWMIIEGYCTNADVQQNLRYFRSTDTGNKWQLAYYDLDWAFYYHNAFKHVLSPSQTWQHLTLTRNIIKNPTFRAKFLARTSALMATTLSNEHVTERIDYYENLLDPEVKRERKRWNGSYDAWKNKVQYLRDFINIGEDGYDQMGNMINKLIDYIGLTDAEIEQYFSRWR